MSDKPSYIFLHNQPRKNPLFPELAPSFGSRAALERNIADMLRMGRRKRLEAPINLDVYTKNKFDSEGTGYDHATAERLRKENPLTMPKPIGAPLQGESWERANPGAFEAWVWHPEEGNWFVHGSSRDPKSGLMLKGRNYKTWHRTVQGEKDAGNVIYKRADGRYYAHPPEIARKHGWTPDKKIENKKSPRKK